MLKSLILVALMLPGFVCCAASIEEDFPREKYLALRWREKGPLFEACWQDDFEGVALHSDSIDEKYRTELLVIASHCCAGGYCCDIDGVSQHVKIMRFLLEKGCFDVHDITKALGGPAICTRCSLAAKVLIEYGADVNYALEKKSILHAAVLRKNEEVVIALLKAGANILARDKCGQTPENYISMLPDLERPSMKRIFDEFKCGQL